MPECWPDIVSVCTLSNEFLQRFRQRVGEEPTLEHVNLILAGAKRIRRQQTLYKRINGEFCRYEFLGEFWNHEHGMILLVNENARTAVTVYTHKDKYPAHPVEPGRRRHGRKR